MNIIDFRSLRINPKSQFYISELSFLESKPFKGKHETFWKRLTYEIGKSSLKNSLEDLVLDGWKIDPEYIREMIFEYNLYDLRVRVIKNYEDECEEYNKDDEYFVY